MNHISSDGLEVPGRSGAEDGLKLSSVTFLVIFICFLINFTDGFDLIAMSVAAPAIAAELKIGSATLGAVFSSALVGMAIGAMFLAPLGDKLGRRFIILLSITIISTAMLATFTVASLKFLIAARFVTGVGVGGVLAGTASLVSEFTPGRYRSFAVIFCATGFTLGTVVVGPIASMVINAYGWREVFALGGLFGFSTLLVAWFLLPESIAFLSARATGLQASPARSSNTGSAQGAGTANAPPVGIRYLFDPAYRTQTLFLWGLFFGTYWTSYFLMNWTPQLFVLSGASLEHGIRALSVLTFGSLIGAWTLGYFSAKVNLSRLIAIMLFLSALLIGVYSAWKPGNVPIMLAFMFLIGLSLNGGLTALYGLATNIYPLEIRSTGVGWAIGIGRIGAILSPMVAGWMVASGWGLYGLLPALALPTALIAGFLAWRLGRGFSS